jgi:hypothetical protein
MSEMSQKCRKRHEKQVDSAHFGGWEKAVPRRAKWDVNQNR